MRAQTNDFSDLRFSGLERLYGQQALKSIQDSHAMIIGLGGVGSWAAEYLVRSGIGSISLVDFDEICITNTNRQIQAMQSSIGQSKILHLKNRFLDINPNISIYCHEDFYTEKSSDQILSSRPSFVIDAIDSLSAKALLIIECQKLKIPLFVSGAAGGKKDPTKIKTIDLSLSKNDLLLQKLRKRLRQRHDFPRGKVKFQIPCVYSEELASLPENCDTSSEPAKKLDCSGAFGSSVMVTSLFGLYLSHQAIDFVTSRENKS